MWAPNMGLTFKAISTTYRGAKRGKKSGIRRSSAGAKCTKSIQKDLQGPE